MTNWVRIQWVIAGASMIGLCCAVALCGPVAAENFTDAPVPIREVLASPETYHLRLVLLEGIVHNVKPLEPYEQPSGTACYSAYLFRLQDDTGSLSIAVLGLCGVPLLRDPDVAEGDHVFVKANVQAPGRGGYFLSTDGVPVAPQNQKEVQALAVQISRAE
jgi:hypothetical protein